MSLDLSKIFKRSKLMEIQKLKMGYEVSKAAMSEWVGDMYCGSRPFERPGDLVQTDGGRPKDE
jgi:hypothetical protein